jgi:hypothetical protein
MNYQLESVSIVTPIGRMTVTNQKGWYSVRIGSKKTLISETSIYKEYLTRINDFKFYGLPTIHQILFERIFATHFNR